MLAFWRTRSQGNKPGETTGLIDNKDRSDSDKSKRMVGEEKDRASGSYHTIPPTGNIISNR